METIFDQVDIAKTNFCP